MQSAVTMKLRRRGAHQVGLSLTEVLIGILILGVGAISLATLFPVGLLRLKRALEDTRSVQVGRSGGKLTSAAMWVYPPIGPVANAFLADPLNPKAMPIANPDARQQAGEGVPVVLDPLGILMHEPWAAVPDYPTGINERRLGFLVGRNDEVLSRGLPRFRGIYISRVQQLLGLDRARREAQYLFAAADDLTFWSDRPFVPLQLPNPGAGQGPQFLRPTSGIPFRPGTLYREARYTFFVVARKVTAAQLPPEALNGVDDDADDDDADEWHWPGVDGLYGPTGRDTNGDGLDDGLETDYSVGPHQVSVAVLLQRAFGPQGEQVLPFIYPLGPDGVAGNEGDDDGDGNVDWQQLDPLDPGVRVPDPEELLWPGSDDSPPNVIRIPLPDPTGLARKNVPRADRLPEIRVGAYVLDATYRPDPDNPSRGPRHAYWYRVTGREQGFDPFLGPVLRITVDGRLRNLYAEDTLPSVGVLVYIRTVVGVIETTVP
jgi:hypothetical protein